MPFNPLQYPIANMPPRLVSVYSSWLGHVPFALTLMQMARPRTLVELGVLQGDSYCAFCQAAAVLQLQARFTAVDRWPDDPALGINGNEMFAALSRFHDQEYGRFSQLIRADFQMAAGQFATGSIDLLHLDGNPAYAALKLDLQTWLPKVSDRGIILLHGISNQMPDGGAKKLWAELIAQNHPSMSFEHAGGLGVLAWGAQAPKPVLEFIQDARNDPRAIRAHFARMGESVELLQQQRRLANVLVNVQTGLNDWKKRAGHWVDPKGIDMQLINTDLIRFTGNLGDQVRFALNDDLTVRSSLAGAAPTSAAPVAPMQSFSVIICSVDDKKFVAVEQMYRRLLGDSAQIIRIADAKGMCEGYNRGIAQSTGDVLIFSHDDVEFLIEDLAPRLLIYLNKYDIVGVAGTTRLVAGWWVAAGPPFIFGQVAHTTKTNDYSLQFFGGHGAVIENIKAVDGLMFAVRRAVVEKIKFDESFDSFHLYDLDFSTQAHVAGFKLAVARDLWVIHDSIGSFDQRWQMHAARFEQKWASRLEPNHRRPFHIQVLDVKSKDEILEVFKQTT